MVNTLLLINIVLIVLLAVVTIMFHRRGARLEEERKHAIESEDIKSHYLADVSQTFRDPIDIILKRCEVIESLPCLKDRQQAAKAIEDIRFQSKQLLQYTKEILELSNTEGNIPHSSKIEVNLIELILSYRREILYSVKKPVQVNVITEVSPDAKVWLDTTMFRQLIMHILQIAAQNTDEGSINIRYATENNGLRFWIESTSKPIPKETLEKMFTDEQVVPAQHKSNEKEIAFTLSICKAIIDNMKGTIKATSKETKLGNVNAITFWFPCNLNIS